MLATANEATVKPTPGAKHARHDWFRPSTYPKHQASYLIQGPGGSSVYGTSSPLQWQQDQDI